MRDIVTAIVVVIGCGAPGRDPSTAPDAGDDNTNPTGSNCSDAAKLVYTVDSNDTLSTFDPVSKQFVDLGTLDCPTTGLFASPFSMGIDRNAGAWVLYSSGELFRVDTTSLACTATQWSSPAGLAQFGMGFSTDAAGGSTDTLFIAGGAGPSDPTSALNRLDTTTMAPSRVGTVTGWPELTGTGNAELWGFFPSTNGSTPRVAKLDKATGAAVQTFNLPTLSGTPLAWAFAFFGGDYFVFLMRDIETSTTVYQIDGGNGAVKGMTATGTRNIVGAGVSTCAPVVIF